MQPLILAFLSLLSFNGPVVQAKAVTAKPAEDHVIIQRRRIVLVRSGNLAKEFPHKRRAVVIYPIISGPRGARNAAVLRRIRSVLDFKNIFDYSLKEYREDAWLDEFSYVVNHNGNYLLDITFMQSGSAAYPDDQQKHFLINLKDGSIVKAADVFESDKLESLAAAVDRQLQTEIKQIAKEIGSEEKEATSGAFDNLKFERQHLDDFSVSNKGVTFLYDAGFPHVIRALQPNGRYFFSYSALREYIKGNGLLGRFKN